MLDKSPHTNSEFVPRRVKYLVGFQHCVRFFLCNNQLARARRQQWVCVCVSVCVSVCESHAAPLWGRLHFSCAVQIRRPAVRLFVCLLFFGNFFWYGLFVCLLSAPLLIKLRRVPSVAYLFLYSCARHCCEGSTFNKITHGIIVRFWCARVWADLRELNWLPPQYCWNTLAVASTGKKLFLFRLFLAMTKWTVMQAGIITIERESERGKSPCQFARKKLRLQFFNA